MDIRKSFSKLKKKLKHPQSKRKPDRTGADSGGERADLPGSLSRPVPHLMAGDSYNQGGIDAGGSQGDSTDGPPPDAPEREPTGGSDDDLDTADGGKVSQKYLYPHSDIEVAKGSGSGRGGNRADGRKDGRVHPSSSAPSFLRNGKPDGMWTQPF